MQSSDRSTRASSSEIADTAKTILASDFVQTLFKTAKNCVLILNQQRQIVAANPIATSLMTKSNSFSSIIGKRPGEALGCVNATDSSGGCGAGKNCTHCGALIAILESHESADEHELKYYLQTKKQGITLHIKAVEKEIMGQQMTIISFDFPDI